MCLLWSFTWESWVSFNFSDEPKVKSGGVISGLSGYYYKDVWQTLSGPPVRQFSSSSAISQCLQGKVVHLYGDSTIRQWFEHVSARLPGS